MRTTLQGLLIAGGWLAGTLPGLADLTLDQTFTPGNGTILEGNLTGQVFTGNITGLPAGASLMDLTVGLTISGGYNGDLYAYLIAPNGRTDILLYKPGEAVNGFGAYGSGLNLTLADASANGSIQQVTSGGVLTGTYQPASPLASLDGSPAGGNWRLFVADEGVGGGNATLNSWTLDLTATPEPQIPAAAYAGLVLVLGGARWLARRHKKRRPE